MKPRQIFDYTEPERFAVVRKLPQNKRYYCNFKALYATREEAEALRLSTELKPAGSKFYVIEIQRITGIAEDVKGVEAQGGQP